VVADSASSSPRSALVRSAMVNLRPAIRSPHRDTLTSGVRLRRVVQRSHDGYRRPRISPADRRR
jgi:hypothetical protein